MNPVPLALSLLGIIITALAYRQSKKGSFYQNTLALAPLGIYVWGDGLILGPFWILSGFIFLILSSLNIARYLLLFYAIRSAFEVTYWLNHQAANNQYKPPLPRLLNHLKPRDAAILYQLLHTAIVTLTLFSLLSIS